ncbi:carboxymuconolactone decarboxylase family protein [Shimazuella kribbensis]|uniref:carboxymuconolactone decarboxylase family protein n=1 Tax=Shimazuella kribbensis TaxID=139808 RepID=UPI0004014A6F|nr:carboxymuconolactone decarboxylase family protein [Shimazuella kribbensis]
MNVRLNHREANPKVYEAMLQQEKTILQLGIDRTIYEIIKIRASQINGCSFCIDRHSKDFLASGQEVARLIHIPIWRESSLFTEKEKAVLELTEEVTKISQGGLPEEVYIRVRKQFNEEEFITLILAINTINAWNRIGISTGMFPNCY